MVIKKRALIIGCGIAGPAVALFLQRAGFDAVIYEAQQAPADYAGLFLNIASNGLDVLKKLGIDTQVMADGFPCPHMVMWSGRGKRLGVVRNGSGDYHGTVIKRGLLQKAIREAAIQAGVKIEYGKKLKDIKVMDKNKVIAYFEDGSETYGDFLVGCDGIHSRTRQIMNPNTQRPTYTGLLSLGGFTHSSTIPPTPGVQNMVFGKKAFFGYLVKPSGEIYWFSNMEYPGQPTRKELSAISNDEWRQKLLTLHNEDLDPVQEIIRSTKGEIGVYPIYDIPYQSIWYKGPIVLIGDAVHATSPNAGQGASMALEDAIVLTKCLRDIPRLEEAFAKYESLRRERVEKIVEYSRRIGQSKTVSNPIALWFRDMMMPVFLKLFANSNAHSWMYAYKVDWNEKVM